MLFRKKKKEHPNLLNSNYKNFIEFSGFVEKFTHRDLVGFLKLEDGEESVRVDIYINDTLAVSTWTSLEAKRPLPFKVNLFNLKFKSLWNYTKRSDKIYVMARGKMLPIFGAGFFKYPDHDGEFDLETLKQKSSDGFVFNQFGTFQLSKLEDEAWRNDIFGLYDKLNSALESISKNPLSICYGTLLGAVRGKQFIVHDHDFDTCYICNSNDGARAKLEVAEMARFLRSKGFTLQLKPSCIYAGHPDFGSLTIDIFHLYFDESGELKFPFGSASPEPFTRSDFKGYTTIEMSGRKVFAIDDPKLFVSRIYGAGWNIPNPGFSWKKQRVKQDRIGRLTQSEINQIME